MVLRQKRERKDVFIIDASKGYVKVGKNNKLQASDIKKIVDIYIERKEIPKYSKKVSRDEIRKNGYNLNIPRYVDSSEDTESWDIYASMMGGIPNADIDSLKSYWDAFPNLKKHLFNSNETPYSSVAVADIKSAILESDDVKAFISNFEKAFHGFDEFLEEKLIKNMENINPVKEEEKIGNEIFERLNNIPLIDKYNAYQILNDNWSDIAIDFEVINTEGKMAIKVVEPNMVMKKDKEIQEGYKGRILPFELVQKALLSDELNEIKTKEDKINEIVASYEELIESLTEEDKESDILNEASDAFNNKGVTARLKELKKADSEEEKKLKEILNKYTKLNKEEKELKKKVKDLISNLNEKTKETIENLSDEKANEMVKEKWIKPLVNALKELPNQIINELIKEVQALAEKYASTLIDLEEEIKETENELSSMIDDLCGSHFDMKGLAQFKNLLGGN